MREEPAVESYERSLPMRRLGAFRAGDLDGLPGVTRGYMHVYVWEQNYEG